MLAFTTLITHGANWIALKTENELNARSRKISTTFAIATAVVTVIATPFTFWVSPWMIESYNQLPIGYVLPLIAIAGIAGAIFFSIQAAIWRRSSPPAPT